MNAFSKNYEPQLTWKRHDTSKMSKAGQKGSQQPTARLSLPGSRRGVIPLIDIPSRDSINTVKTSQRDRTDMIKRGGL